QRGTGHPLYPARAGRGQATPAAGARFPIPIISRAGLVDSAAEDGAFLARPDPMPAIYEQDGIRFQYPEDWALSREENPNGWTVSLQSLATAFLMLTFDGDMPEAELMAETALEAMQAEYAGLESEPVCESIAGQPACGHDMRFFS